MNIYSLDIFYFVITMYIVYMAIIDRHCCLMTGGGAGDRRFLL